MKQYRVTVEEKTRNKYQTKGILPRPEYRDEFEKVYQQETDDISIADVAQLVEESPAELQQLDADNKKLRDLVEDALHTDGGHHKQWYLEQIADLLDIEHDGEGIAP